jgi:putative chitinase
MRAHEFISESRIKPSGNDSAQAWIDYFLTSTHPSLKGQDPETLKRMALAARNKAVHNPPKTKSTFKPSKPNPNARYWWQEKDEGIEVENFADGKKPGRKGLAKRSGVNTKASVSSLRKTAKNSTGEKARMAHWLANMKAGRAKKESLDEGNVLTLKDFVIKVSQHAFDQTLNRNVSVRHVDSIIKNISTVKNSIMGLPAGTSFILHNGKGTGVGIRKLDNNKLVLSTVYNTNSDFVRGKHPTFKVNTNESEIIDDLDEGWKDWVAGAAIGAAALGASGDAEAAKKKPVEKPAVVQQIKKQDVKKIDPLTQVSKKEISNSVTGNPHEVVLKKAAEKAGIQGQELVAFLSQCAHETLDFKHMKEIGGKLDFKKYDIRFAPNKAKSLGNTKPGDGAKYAGRGYIQLTGKYNYAAASKAIYGDDRLVRDPSLVEKPEVAAKTSVWYWQNRVSNKVKNFDNVKDVTKGINPGMKHIDQRKDKFQDFKVAMR